jgi:hypothetical protein
VQLAAEQYHVCRAEEPQAMPLITGLYAKLILESDLPNRKDIPEPVALPGAADDLAA